jgi:phage terminase small subunit
MLDAMSVQDLAPLLNPQHKQFADNYLATQKVSESARLAGYAPKSAHVAGNRLLKRPDVQRYLRTRMAEIDAEAENLGSQVITELKDMAFANIADFITVQPDGTFNVDFSKASREQLKALASVKTKTSRKYNNKGEHIATDTEAAFTMADKYRGLELLGRHEGLFKAEEQRVVLDVADRLLEARRRLRYLDNTENGLQNGEGGGG